MATVAEVRSLLDTLERTRSRADQVVQQIAEAEAALARLREELDGLTPGVTQVETEFKEAVSRLSFAGRRA